ncbi:MAG TPA: SMP-30/gluconolactonase/LRE family protein [Actinomycetota bacterium]|nr:SMP-30/gluconolactonase/LRE family protein [Actinomycetota bacterium]
MSEPRVILGGRAFVESPRWHDGRLWFADWGTDEVIAVDLEGNSEVVAHGPGGFGWSIDWLPDGRLLVTGQGLVRVEADGSRVPHAVLSDLAEDWNELVVDGRGNAYVNGRLFGPEEEGPSGIIAVITPDGGVRQVGEGLAFPNGMAITPDNRTLVVAESWAEQLTAYDIGEDGSLSRRRVWAATPGDHPDGICLDADGAVWYADVGNAHCVRVREGGEMLATITLDRGAFACTLGGPDGRALFMLAAEWRGFENVQSVIADRTGQVLVADAPAPRAGRP